MDTETKNANRRAAFRWGAFVVGLLSLQVAGGVMAIVLATGDQSVAVVPDYHQKALDWDRERAVQDASRDLGWTCDLQIVPSVDSGDAGLRLSLLDREMQPVEIRQGEVQLYHHARAGQVRAVRLPAGRISRIELPDCFSADGWWQVSLDVTDDEARRFVDSREVLVQRDRSVGVVETEGDS